jgi:ADP-ribosyl-[dinitrogen reductase] hydrolase
LSFQKEQILDRAKGALLGTAVADALGAGYEFQPPLPDEVPVVFKKRIFDIGEYTDDTAQLLAVARASAKGDIIENLDLVAAEFHAWYESHPKDIGIQTSYVFGTTDWSADSLRDSALNYLDSHERAAGNGSLMRTASIALPYLSDPEKVTQAADLVSSLTHVDTDCREACIIWSKAIRHAILFENFDGVQLAINELPAFRQTYWNAIFDEAEAADRPSDFPNNGWVIHAIQAAYKAVMMTASESQADLVAGIEAAVRCGKDTDTVAAIAGGLLGARWGVSAIPSEWLELVHGWPGYKASDIEALAETITEAVWL